MTTATATTNAATTRQLYASFGGGDIPAFLDGLAEDIAWDSRWEDNYAQHAGGPRHFTPIRGKADAAGFFEVMGGYTFHDFEVLELIADADKVVARVRLEYTMPSGGRYRDEQLHLWTFGPDGKAVGLQHFMDTAKLLAAHAGVDTTTARG